MARMTRERAENFLRDLGKLLSQYEMEIEVETEPIGYSGYSVSLHATDKYGDGWDLGTWVTPADCVPEKVTQEGVYYNGEEL